jgi:hypothetical protein
MALSFGCIHAPRPKTKIDGRSSMAIKDDGSKPSTYFLKFRDCPACKETVFAAEGATFAPSVVMFEWHCDLCGHRFETVEPVVEAA